jgi:hypothetical protein
MRRVFADANSATSQAIALQIPQRTHGHRAACMPLVKSKRGRPDRASRALGNATAFHAGRRVPRPGNSPRQNSAYLSTAEFLLVLRLHMSWLRGRFE